MIIGDYSIQHDYNKRFPLWHCILYYLNWYERTDNKWNDLKNCLTMDGYCGEVMSNADVVNIVLNIADDFNCYCAIQNWKLLPVRTVLTDDWYVARYRKQGLENPDWLVMLDRLFSKFALDYTRQQVKIPKPDFKKGDLMRYSGYKAGKTYKEANAHTKKYTWEGTAPDWDWRKYHFKKVQ